MHVLYVVAGLAVAGIGVALYFNGADGLTIQGAGDTEAYSGAALAFLGVVIFACGLVTHEA